MVVKWWVRFSIAIGKLKTDGSTQAGKSSLVEMRKLLFVLLLLGYS
jgi:hypothetical protein